MGEGGLRRTRRFKATVRMVKPWSDYWLRKPTVDEVLECFADAVRRGEIDDHFVVEVEESSE
jgi:hypothetical protein